VGAALSRDRYLDALRAAALTRVVVFHMFGFAWLSFVFPAMGVMFALGGSLMAASMRRSAASAVRGRIRRLLPALWVLGAIVVPAMFWHGWTTGDVYSRPLYQIVFWVAPIAEPPGNAWAESATVVLWYLVTYLWLVLLSPLAWRAYRRFPLPAVLLPLLVLVLTQLGPVDVGGPAGDVVVNVATFGACWFVGFAHRTGQLARLNTAVVFALAGCCTVAGAAWAVTHPADDGSVNLNDIPLAQAVYSLGFVLVALRFPPPMGWLARIRPLDAAVTVLNARAVTVYLWHNVAIALAFPLGDAVGVWHLGDAGYLALAVVLLTVAVGGLGWVEDLAARRRPALLPSRAARRPPKTPAGHPAHQPLPAPDVGHLAVDRQLAVDIAEHRGRDYPAPAVGLVQPHLDHRTGPGTAGRRRPARQWEMDRNCGNR
jgi:peptidoglycan-N-acetylglucosamine deacetylase